MPLYYLVGAYEDKECKCPISQLMMSMHQAFTHGNIYQVLNYESARLLSEGESSTLEYKLCEEKPDNGKVVIEANALTDTFLSSVAKYYKGKGLTCCYFKFGSLLVKNTVQLTSEAVIMV